MRRIRSITAVTTKPADTATGTIGFYSKGDPLNNIEPTHLNPEAMNSIQGELLAMATDLGEAESYDNDTQCVATLKRNSFYSNAILNGGFAHLRNPAVSSWTAIADNVYTAQRWKYNKVGTMVHTLTRNATANYFTAQEFATHSMLINCTTAQSVIGANDRCYLVQHVEGWNFRNLFRLPFVLSFWVKSSKTGLFAVALTNQGTGSLPSNTPTRSYVGTYTVAAANTWQKVTITIPDAGTVGGFFLDNNIGISVKFILAAGSTFQTTANAWQTGNFLTASGVVNLCDAVNNTFEVTNVKLEPGIVASPYVAPHYALELDLLSSYYQQFSDVLTPSFDVTNAGTYRNVYRFMYEMRAIPTVTLANVANSTSFPATPGTPANISARGFTESRTATASASAQNFTSSFTADAEIYGV